MIVMILMKVIIVMIVIIVNNTDVHNVNGNNTDKVIITPKMISKPKGGVSQS